MATRSYGNVMKSGRASMGYAKGPRHGQFKKNLASGRMSRPNPTGGIKGKTGPIKGMDKGTG